MKMTPNKLCLTQKGIEWINQQKQQYTNRLSNLNTLNLKQRNKSLPLINIRKTNIDNESRNKLSSLSKQKIKLQKIGLKKMQQKNQDSLMRRMLHEQLQKETSYIQTLIPNLVKMTKQKNQISSIQSRLQRARVYVSKLQYNFDNKFVFHKRTSSQNKFII